MKALFLLLIFLNFEVFSDFLCSEYYFDKNKIGLEEAKEEALKQLIYEYSPRWLTGSIETKFSYKKDKKVEFKEIVENDIKQELILQIQPEKWEIEDLGKNKKLIRVCVEKEKLEKEAEMLIERIKNKRKSQIDYAYSFYKKGNYYLNIGELDTAIENFKKGLEEIEKFKGYYEIVKTEEGDLYLKPALEEGLSKAVLQKEKGLSFYDKAFDYSKADYLDEAREYFEKAKKNYRNPQKEAEIEGILKEKESQFENFIEKGKDLYSSGRCKKAMDYFQKAMDLNRNSERARNLYQKAEKCFIEEKRSMPPFLRFSLMAGTNSELFKAGQNIQHFSDLALKGLSLSFLLNPRTLRDKSFFSEMFFEFSKFEGPSDLYYENDFYEEINLKIKTSSFGLRIGSKSKDSPFGCGFLEVLYSRYDVQILNWDESFGANGLNLGVGFGAGTNVFEARLTYRVNFYLEENILSVFDVGKKDCFLLYLDLRI